MMKRWKSKPQRLKPITKAWRQNIFGKKKNYIQRKKFQKQTKTKLGNRPLRIGQKSIRKYFWSTLLEGSLDLIRDSKSTLRDR